MKKDSAKLGSVSGTLKRVRNDNDAWFSAELVLWKLMLKVLVGVDNGENLSSRYGPQIKLHYKVGVKYY